MRTIRTIAFVIGFTMLFFLPMDARGLKYYFLCWLPMSVALIALSGAFKKRPL